MASEERDPREGVLLDIIMAFPWYGVLEVYEGWIHSEWMMGR